MEPWTKVDEGWGRRAVEFATLAEPSNCREYVHVHERLHIGTGNVVLDVACGSGLAIELATARGARCSGIDASERLAAVARDRTPTADIQIGDMGALPWPDEAFDVVTSFRGIWRTTPRAVDEAWRVLVPGGRIALTCWGNVGKSPGAWMFEPFRWATESKVEHQADMVSLGFPGVGETFLADGGFDVDERFEVPCFFEYADPEMYARAMAASGPGYEAIRNIGEEEFVARAVELAAGHVRGGLPLRGRIELFGFIGTKR